MNVHAPDCYGIEDLLLFGDITKGVVSQGIVANLPDLNTIEGDVIERLERDFRTFLANIHESERLQVQFYKNADYQRELQRFHDVTTASPHASRFSRRQRTERYERYLERMQQDQLIQSELRFFISSKISAKGLATKAHYQRILDTYKHGFQQRVQLGDNFLKSYAGSMRALNSTEHFSEILHYFAPTMSKLYLPEELYIDPHANLMRLARASSVHHQVAPDYGFYMDGHYFSVLVLATMPGSTFMGMVKTLTSLAIPNYRVVVNCYPLALEAELQKAQSNYDKLDNSTWTKKGRVVKPKIAKGIEDTDRRIKRLMGNDILPFMAQFIIITHDETKEGLRSNLAALKGVIGKLGGMRYYEPTYEIATLNYFNAAIPGWCFDRYDDYTHKIDDVNLVNLLPLGATSKGDLAAAEWIHDGDGGNLIGGRTFTGAPGNESPGHALMTGSSGAGKSLMVNDILVQTEPYYDYTVIIDAGLSYGIYVQCLEKGVTPIVIRSNGNYTFNPFDTRGLPLSSELLSNSTAMLSLLIGGADSPDKRRYREALMASTVRSIYNDYYVRWSKLNEDKLIDTARHALAVEKWLKEKSPPGDGFIDAWNEFLRFKKEYPHEVHTWLGAYSDEDVKQYIENPKSAELLRDVSFTYFKPHEFPQLRDIQDETAALGRGKTHDAAEYNIIGKLLEVWLRDGQYGPIVDGASNIDLSRKIVHFELGSIKESERELLAVAGFLITNDVRNHIMTMPRGERKRLILEELSAFLSLDNGPKIVRDYYERMRKYNCWVLSILQNFGRIAEQSPGVTGAIVSNCQQIFLLKSNSQSDLDLISKTYPIPEVTRNAVMSFPKPEGSGPDVYNGYAIVQLQEGRPKVTLGRNYAHHELLYVSSSTGSVFEKRNRQLRSEPDIIDAIIRYSTQMYANPRHQFFSPTTPSKAA